MSLPKPYYEADGITIYNADCREVLPSLPAVGFILADPPYHEIQGDFDFVWADFDEYLKDVQRWAAACANNLDENGTLFWFGDDKKIAYSQIILDRLLDLQNSLVWYKYNLRGGMFGSAGGDTVRSFPICTERVLMYSRDQLNLTSSVGNVRDYIRGEIERAKGRIILKEVNRALGTATNGGGVASACLSLDKKEPAMFTEEMYLKLRDWLNGGQRREYEYLRREYEELRRPFNNDMGLTEVLQFNTDTTVKGHETVKPVELIRALIDTCSVKTQTILDPFMGSGTTLVAAKQLGRKAIGIELEEKYCAIAVGRLRQGVLPL